jgi:serine/threonine-protein kinase ATR
MSPYMEKIAPFLVCRWATHRSMLIEFCRLIALPPVNFIKGNLSSALPPLFAARDLRTLEKLSEDLEIRLSSLFLHHSEHVLAHIFLLGDQAMEDNAIAFILEILTQSSADASQQIDLQSVVKASVIQLLASLVIRLGSENDNEAEAVCIATSA